MLKSKRMRCVKIIAASVMGIALLSATQAGTPLKLGKTVSSADVWEMPSQVTFHIFDARDAQMPIVSQSFEQGEWNSTGELAEGKALRISAEVTALDGDSTDSPLWFDTEVDGVLVGTREAVVRATSDMYVDGEIKTGVGVRFPGGGLQTAPGITSETDPNLAAHEGNASAHHSRYEDSEAWSIVLAKDGSGSTLDADLLDGKDSADFAISAHLHSGYVKDTGDTMTGTLNIGVKSGDALRVSSPDVAGQFQDTVLILNSSGTETIRLKGQENARDPSPVLEMRLSDGTLIFDMDASMNAISVNNDSGIQTVLIDGDSGQAGYIQVEDSAGLRTIIIDGEESAGDGGEILMYNIDNKLTVQIDGDSGTKGGYIQLYNDTGGASITLDANYGNDGRITTQELQITGGSDLSEQFDIDATASVVEPGMLVSIDPRNPGKLVMSWEAYDRKVAGIVSGAGGVKPGMMMGQEGSIANGEYPVALSGRVYAMVDTSKGAIEPGDLLTTSDIPGYAMKVTDHARATGAVIGKAMTPLKEGKGLVLVLVSLQ